MIHGKDGADVVAIPATAIACTRCGGAVAVVQDGGVSGIRQAAIDHLNDKHGGIAWTAEQSSV